MATMPNAKAHWLRIAAIAFLALSAFSCAVANRLDPTRTHPGAANLASGAPTLHVPVRAGERTCQEVLIAESTDGYWTAFLQLESAQPEAYPPRDGPRVYVGGIQVTLDPQQNPWGDSIPAGVGMTKAYTTMCFAVPPDVAVDDTVVKAYLTGEVTYPDRKGVSGFVNRAHSIHLFVDLEFVSARRLADYRAQVEQSRRAAGAAANIWGTSWLVNGLLALVCWIVYANRRDRGAASRTSAVLLMLLSGAATLSAQTPKTDQWAPVRFMLGTWEGTTSGQAGNGTARREYRFTLHDQFIEERNTTTYPPQAGNAQGEVHEHVSYISYDQARQRLVLRQFHVESFVAQYVQEPLLHPSVSLSFVSEVMENTPQGWRARETYIVHGPDEFEEVFELAREGQPYEVYSRTRFKRVH